MRRRAFPLAIRDVPHQGMRTGCSVILWAVEECLYCFAIDNYMTIRIT
jgi:hypothetical protein